MRNELRDGSGRLVRLESEPATEADVTEANAAGLELTRRIEQLRIPLPLPASGTPLITRPFLPGQDDEAFLRVNNRAFAWHPDQSGWTQDQLADRMNEPWFDPQGFLLHEVNGELAGFCWTKVHPATATDPQLGEIYVIAVDPDFHGSGLGRALTLAGLAHLAAQSVTVGMLHVEQDNTAAVSLYRNLGFSHHDAHCWWALPHGDAS
ncbi:MAG: mycothiol synthase [Actinobacteria bacterium]|uniref:Unannotated protein n=1 Tax=freshwater metagenome TaxID=449393 RepID=A0A6J6Q491_9ZZZZ|nr:mycothiol synthase [Actinomycetota bacterium]MSW31492.1 mycothiol synthase [Actinomycetota bacterium]MSX33376.1 mycothiol synthase [Actinomycetota bacterium]MSX95263.1 mycothiol synthase [Actinomycetota bacterium]MSY24843.1 mycothiol synthase [Actinomycetota bacterium]